MRAKLIFDLPNDGDELKLAQRGKDYYCLLFDLDQEMRGFLKYGHQFKNPEEVMEYVRERIREVKIDDIE